MTMFTPIPVQAYSASAEKTLMVTFFPQDQTNWCWAAVIKMFMVYYGEPQEQYELANRKFGRTDCQEPGPGRDTNRCNKTIFVSEIRQLLVDLGYRSTGSMTADEPLLVSEIEAERPVELILVRRDSNGNPTGGHVVVAVGFADIDGRRKISIHDSSQTHGNIAIDSEDLKTNFFQGKWEQTFTVSRGN